MSDRRQDPAGAWITRAEAAERLGVTPGHVPWVARRAHLSVRSDGDHGLMLDASQVQRLVEERAADQREWVSYVEAAAIVGCSRGTIGAAVRRGKIEHRPAPKGKGGKASLRRSSVEVFAADWEQRQVQAGAAAARAAAEKAERSARRLPPADGDVWLSAMTAGLVLGIKKSRVRQLARAGRLPCVEKDGRYWFRRRDVEQIAAAREFQRIARLAGRAEGRS